MGQVQISFLDETFQSVLAILLFRNETLVQLVYSRQVLFQGAIIYTTKMSSWGDATQRAVTISNYDVAYTK